MWSGIWIDLLCKNMSKRSSEIFLWVRNLFEKLKESWMKNKACRPRRCRVCQIVADQITLSQPCQGGSRLCHTNKSGTHWFSDLPITCRLYIEGAVKTKRAVGRSENQWVPLLLVGIICCPPGMVEIGLFDLQQSGNPGTSGLIFHLTFFQFLKKIPNSKKNFLVTVGFLLGTK